MSKNYMTKILYRALENAKMLCGGLEKAKILDGWGLKILKFCTGFEFVIRLHTFN